MTAPPAGSGDADLVAAAQNGDRAALEALLRRHYDRLYAVCRRLTGDDADAADACQDALIAIVRGLATFDARSSFGTWAYRVATNCSLDELRRRRRRPEPVELGVSRHAAVADAADRVVARVAVDRAVVALPAEFRAAVVLRDLCDLSYEEIAEILEVPVGTVRSRIARGRAALAELLSSGRNRQDRPRRQTGRR